MPRVLLTRFAVLAWNWYQRFCSLFSYFHFIFLGSPNGSFVAFVLIWSVRIITFGLLLRTYLIPWLLALMSNRLRIKSISPRSIRGLRFRKGVQTWRIERVSYKWLSVEGSRRLAVKIEGLTLHISKESWKDVDSSNKRRKRNLTLADLDPSPIARHLWHTVWTVMTFFEPLFRPFLLTYFIACLRLVIKWLPKLTQALSFDLLSCAVTLEEIPGTRLSAENISLHMALTLTQLAQAVVTDDLEPILSSQETGMIPSFSWLKKRLTDGFQRSLDTALKEIHGKVDLSLKVSHLAGNMPHRLQDSSTVPFLLSPGTSDLCVTASFNPKETLIDTHGLSIKLNIGDCSLKVDLLNRLLTAVFPKKPASQVDDTVSSTVAAPGSRRFSLASPASSIASPVYSLTSSLFSPFSPLGSSDGASPRRSFFSPMLLSPRSPFKAFSASMRPRRRRLIQPTAKLKSTKNVSKLSILRQFDISILSVSLSFSIPHSFGSGAYKAIVKQISVVASLSDRYKNALHREHLGSREGQDSFESDAYSLSITLRQITMERESLLQTLRLVRLGRMELETLIYQWPPPLLNPSPFMGSNANSSLLALHLKLSNVHIADRINELHGLLSLLMSRQKKQVPDSPPSSIMSLPKLVMAMESGPIVFRIIYDTDNGEKHRAVEMRNNGATLTLNAEYRHPTTAITRFLPAASSIQSMHWISSLILNIDPVLVRVRSKHDFIGMDDPGLFVSDQDFLDDPPVLSVGNVDIQLVVHAVAQIDGAAEAAAVIDKTSLAADLSVTFESICLELWHPVAVDATLRLVSLVSSEPRHFDLSEIETSPRFHNLPFGISSKIAIERLVVFITAPDINPNDSIDLSRGFSVRTAFALEYCSLTSGHTHWFDHPHRSQNRARLKMVPELLAESIRTAKLSAASSNTPALVRVLLSNFIFKEAVATQFEPDEPAIVGREDSSQFSREIVRISYVQLNLSLTSTLSIDRSHLTDLVDVVLQIPSIRIDFCMAYAYSILLAFHTLKILKPTRPSSVTPRSNYPLILTINASVGVIHGFVTLPKESVRLRIDTLHLKTREGATPKLKWKKFTFLVSPPTSDCGVLVNHKDDWDQFIVLQNWEISLSPLAGSLCVAIDGDSAMLCIPHNFVLAQLVQDLAVSLKAIRHIACMSQAGCYLDMPYPGEEGPKTVPHVTIRLGCFCVEAQDDPIESKLGLMWRVGEGAAKQRLEREEAFKAKVAAIVAAKPELFNEANTSLEDTEHDYAFNAKHTVPIGDARRRLDIVHALDWSLRVKKATEEREGAEHLLSQELRFSPVIQQGSPEFKIPYRSKPPLLRLLCRNLCLIISPPAFDLEQLPDNMHSLGKGLPRDTKFSLLLPLHVHFTLASLRANLRDYPLPLLFIPAHTKAHATTILFDTDLIVAEEVGTERSVEWIECPIIDARHALHGGGLFSLSVPKTIMPVKTYASPTVQVSTANPTIISWGVSSMPVIQDLMRIVDSITTPTRDSSPAVGFWDKMRLVLHWTVRVTFAAEVCLYIKGTRDPYKLDDAGAGFVLCWQGSPEIRIGHENHQRELIQVMSHEMLIAVPNLSFVGHDDGNTDKYLQGSKSLKKVFARLSSGVRFGLGFLFERSCGPECLFCTESAFHRQCRYFSFRPHYEIKLEIKDNQPEIKTPEDSFNEFRSDFIHLAVSLTSSTESKESKPRPKPSSLYLTPNLFAHFWSWCSLFEGALSLPIRQGSYFPSRPISPKFGRHLATLKYRISLSNLYIMHGYMDDSRETWTDGVIPWVGVKARIDEVQADLHQRDEESMVPGPIPGTTRTIRRKPIYAAEVNLKGLDLRALLAIFEEPLKQKVGMTAPPQRSNYRRHEKLPTVSPQSLWYDLDDFVELDWTSPKKPILHLLPAASCPHFTYFKQNSALAVNHPQTSKFGSEQSHPCLLGQEPSVTQTQISLASGRLDALMKKVDSSQTDKPHDLRMVTLLKSYISHLKDIDSADVSSNETYHHIPADNVSPQEWAEFEHVYQIHFPSVFLDSAVRDIMMQYYYCSRDHRSLEYHMATRAVKFIRDQANTPLAAQILQKDGKDREPTSTASMAASAIRKILKVESNTRMSVDVDQNAKESPHPMEGWSEGVSLTKSHYCLLLKPQVVLREEALKEVCIVAAAQAKLQSFAIMDLANFDDPASGKVMSRNYSSITGFQAFAPTGVMKTSSDGSVPLEVLIDLRCENKAFERLVPQTAATFHYDKFNRLRLHNKVTCNPAGGRSTDSVDGHLQDETDLIRVHIPRFTVSASESHFQAISTIVNKLLLFSDAAYKTRSDRVQTMLFNYDLTDLQSVTGVITNLQTRLRDALETERVTLRRLRVLDEEALQSLHQLKAHIFSLSEELNLLFEAIKLFQDRFDEQTDRKSALLLHASSKEISWRMLGEGGKLLTKLVVSNTNFRWLSRQDSSVVSHLTVGNMSALDASRNAIWSEILTKYNEPANHPLLKRGLFLTADWTILPPVGGITIYETFELNFHPLKLQIDAKVGQHIMEYIWPSRKNRRKNSGDNGEVKAPVEVMINSPTSSRTSLDSPRALYNALSLDLHGEPAFSPPHRKLGNSRSFTDLRSVKNTALAVPRSLTLLPFPKRTNSSEEPPPTPGLPTPGQTVFLDLDSNEQERRQTDGDAQVMKSRSTQKSFVLVRISSIHILLSMVKAGSFECHDARIKTKELEYRNQTWSFEELAGQFIPSNMNWRGWMKMAFNQPLLPVLPVARELISKTKWMSSRTSHASQDNALQFLHPRFFAIDNDPTKPTEEREKKGTPSRLGGQVLTSASLTTEPENMEPEEQPRQPRVKSLFNRKNRSRSRG